MKALWQTWWAERLPRERRLLLIGAVLAGLALFYSVLIQPALDNGVALRAVLPGMKRQLAQMDAQAAEAKRLAASAQSAAPVGDSLSAAIQASLSDHGLASAQAQSLGTAVQVSMNNVSFAQTIGWLDDIRKQLKVQVSQAHIVATVAVPPGAAGPGQAAPPPLDRQGMAMPVPVGANPTGSAPGRVDVRVTLEAAQARRGAQ